MIKSPRESAERGLPGFEAILKEGYAGSRTIGDTSWLEQMAKQSYLLSTAVKTMSSPKVFSV